jgi:Ring finger domain
LNHLLFTLQSIVAVLTKMNLLDRETELFELFGEMGTCAICQEDLVEGERTRAIRSCQHLFHPPCIEAWLKQKAECPMCRTVLSEGDNELMAAQLRILQVNLDDVQTILDQIRAIHAPDVIQSERNVLSFCLSDGILKRFPNAFSFNNSRDQIIGIMDGFTHNNISPIRIDFTSRSALVAYNKMIKAKIANLTDNHIKEIQSQLSANLAIRPIWAD